MNNLTEQEKKFADAFVYLFFHAPALMPGMKEDAAVYAGYDVPVDRNAADNFARAFVNIVENIPKARIMNKP